MEEKLYDFQLYQDYGELDCEGSGECSLDDVYLHLSPIQVILTMFFMTLVLKLGCLFLYNLCRMLSRKYKGLDDINLSLQSKLFTEEMCTALLHFMLRK